MTKRYSPFFGSNSLFSQNFLSCDCGIILNRMSQFMYQGKATFYHERMKQFVEAAKSLQITEISTGLNLEDDGQETEDNPQEEMEPISDNNESVGESRNTEEMETINGTSNTKTRVSNHGLRQPKTFVANSTNSNVCPECERIFGCSANMKRHYDSVHLGKRQTVANPTKSNVCPECEKIFGDSSNMKKHYEKVHLGTKYPCCFETNWYINRPWKSKQLYFCL